METNQVELILERLMTQSQDELMHYGRKGQRWYQHIFGKEQSQAKYSKSGGKSQNRPKTKSSSPKQSLNAGTKKEQARKAKRMSDRELNDIVKRLEAESRYVKLTASEKDPWMTRFLDKMKDVPINIVSGAATELGKNAAVNYFNKKYPQTKKGK